VTLKYLRQILKSLADDSRLRIINLLYHKKLKVNDICRIIKHNQSSVSKHLVRLRLLHVLNDRRAGNHVYYSINKKGKAYGIIRLILARYKNVRYFKDDFKRMKKIHRGLYG